MSASLLVCYFLTKFRQIWGYLHFWMRYHSEIFLGHSWDIGSQVFTLLGWAYILTFEFLCAGLKFQTSDLVTFWLSEGQLLRPSGLVFSWMIFSSFCVSNWSRTLNFIDLWQFRLFRVKAELSRACIIFFVT